MLYHHCQCLWPNYEQFRWAEGPVLQRAWLPDHSWAKVRHATYVLRLQCLYEKGLWGLEWSHKKHQVAKCNSNGLLLLRTYAMHDFLITNTVFYEPNCNERSLMHLHVRHWHLIDYIITRKQDRHHIRVTKAICGAECLMDHHLIMSKLNICIQPKWHPQVRKQTKRFDICKLILSTKAHQLPVNLENCLAGVVLEEMLKQTGPLSETVFTLSLVRFSTPQQGKTKIHLMKMTRR